MPDRFAEDVAGIGALAEPVRRDLYRYVAGQADAVSREQAARAVGVPVHSAKFHLDRLADEGLLDTEFRRLTGRRGPGAGRPAKLYRRSARQVSVSLPERRYDLAGSILAAAVERAESTDVPLATAVAEAATSAGRSAAHSVRTRGHEVTRAAQVLSAHGFEPREREGEVALANCPFDALARDHPDLVCTMNRSFVSGVLAGLGVTSLEACLDPRPGQCCVRVRRAV